MPAPSLRMFVNRMSRCLLPESLLQICRNEGIPMNKMNPKYGIDTTENNLIAAAAGEREEWEMLYASFAETANAEGFSKIALTFKFVAEVEKEHERRYLKILGRLTDGDFFRRDGEIVWQCRNCGYIVKAKMAPKICPSCDHEQAYFEPMADNY